MTFAFGMGGPVAAFAGLLHMTVHSLTKSAIFFTVGHASQACGTQDMASIRGLIQQSPVIGWGLALGTLAILGMPPFGVFTSEFMVLTTAMHEHSWATPFLLVALGVAVVVVQGARDLARRAGVDEPLGSAWLALALVPAALALVVSGTLVTAAGPHSGGEEIRRFGNLVEVVHIHIGATAVFGVGFLALLALLVAERRRARVELALSGAVLVLLLVQMAVGEVQWREGLPWGLVLLHVTLATAVWVCVVALAARIVLRRRARLP